ncbi:hypothetical protein [Burkholderia pseudomallei]|uniref:hypothetical protein n=1 Tax=Burkholderia pseudomallei TaxID=28450 RepID=UPI0019EBCFC0|nr:hypothetical protein [Burkholderia pseudomallei]MBF3831332.1 hypothetical protein [Burkholderia pseudomallei]
MPTQAKLDRVRPSHAIERATIELCVILSCRTTHKHLACIANTIDRRKDVSRWVSHENSNRKRSIGHALAL